MLVANGETITAPLVAMGLNGMGVPAVALSGLQAGIRTSAHYSNALITGIEPKRVVRALDENLVAVVAGFQGATEDLEITTLGRGGADATAVVLAAALNAAVCEIYGNSDGIPTADSRIVPQSRLLRQVTYEEALELAAMGVRVMQLRALEMGEQWGVPIHLRSAHHQRSGTMIVSDVPSEERRQVSAIAYEEQVGKVRAVGVPNRPGIAAAIFDSLARHEISVGIIGQVGPADLTFMVHDSVLEEAVRVVEPAARRIGAVVSHAAGLAKVSIVGSGMQVEPGCATRLFRTLASEGINIEMIVTSEIRITCIVRRAVGEDAVRALHAAFDLDQPT
jgi:aspartate kinase